jgi:hypothetical protein
MLYELSIEEPVYSKTQLKDRVMGNEYNDFLKYVHPNCLAFDESGRIFVGDSSGTITTWDINVRHLS